MDALFTLLILSVPRFVITVKITVTSIVGTIGSRKYARYHEVSAIDDVCYRGFYCMKIDTAKAKSTTRTGLQSTRVHRNL